MAIRIMICGCRRRGKDSLADCIQRLRPQVQRAAFADGVRDDAATMIYEYDAYWADLPTWESIRADMDKQKHLYGPLLQFVGEYRRLHNGASYWIEQLYQEYKHIHHLVITDCRYPNEAEWGRQHGFTLVRITGPCRGDDGRSDNHLSESQVDELEVDLEFANVGSFADLEQWVTQTLLPCVEGKQ